MKIRSPIARKRTRLEIIPLIDIMFFLLASFMMVSLQMQKVRTLKASLPTATQITSTAKPDMINIAVDTNGRVWLEKTNVTLAQLDVTLSNRFRLDTNLPVYISGDAATLHGDMCDVLETVRHAGVQKVAFMVEGATNMGNP